MLTNGRRPDRKGVKASFQRAHPFFQRAHPLFERAHPFFERASTWLDEPV